MGNFVNFFEFCEIWLKESYPKLRPLFPSFPVSEDRLNKEKYLGVILPPMTHLRPPPNFDEFQPESCCRKWCYFLGGILLSLHTFFVDNLQHPIKNPRKLVSGSMSLHSVILYLLILSRYYGGQMLKLLQQVRFSYS